MINTGIHFIGTVLYIALSKADEYSVKDRKLYAPHLFRIMCPFFIFV